MVRNIVTPWSFRDGREYIVSLAVGENPTKNVSINISDKITAEEWSCNHDMKYIESLTHKTGSYKPFDTFISMIKSAILKKSDSVTLDLMSADDLEAIKLKKLQSELVIRAQIGSPNGNFPTMQNQANNGSQRANSNGHKKKYLIVTYVAEFDRVHYPVAMIYSGLPDATIMQNNILKLQSEVSQLKSANTHLEKKLSHFRDKAGVPHQSKSNIWSNNKDHGNENETIGDESYSQAGSNKYANISDNNNTPSCTLLRNIMEKNEAGQKTNGSGSDNVESNLVLQSCLTDVFKVVESLQEKIATERAEHLEKMNELQAKNASLHSKLLASQDSERELRKAMENLETLLANKSSSSKSREQYSCPKRCFSHNSIQTVKRSSKNNREQKFVDQTRYCTYTRPSSTERMTIVNSGRNTPVYQRSRCSSVSSNRSVGSLASNKSISSHSRPRSLSPSGRIQPFDPTAYVREKKFKQEQIKQLRMSNIESRMRSRSVSRERVNREENYGPETEFVNYTPSTCSVCDVEQKLGCGHEHVDRNRHLIHKGKNNHNHNNLITATKTLNSGNIVRNSTSPVRTAKTEQKSPNKTAGRTCTVNSVGNRGDGNLGRPKTSHLPVRRGTDNGYQTIIRSPQKKSTVNALWKRGDVNSSSKNLKNFSRSNTEESLSSNQKTNRGNKPQNSNPKNPFHKHLEANNSTLAGHNHNTSSKKAQEIDVYSLEQRLSSLQSVIDEHQKYFNKRL